MSRPQTGALRRRSVLEFLGGFVPVTITALATMMLPVLTGRWWWGALLVAELALLPFLLKGRWRIVAIGMVCALLIPGLLAGAACIGVPLKY